MEQNWERTKEIVIKRDKGTCQSCGKKAFLQVHHIIPRARGGIDTLSNLISLCAKCHMLVSPVPDSLLTRLWKIKPIDIRNKRQKVLNEIENFKKTLYR